MYRPRPLHWLVLLTSVALVLAKGCADTTAPQWWAPPVAGEHEGRDAMDGTRPRGAGHEGRPSTVPDNLPQLGHLETTTGGQGARASACSTPIVDLHHEQQDGLHARPSEQAERISEVPSSFNADDTVVDALASRLRAIRTLPKELIEPIMSELVRLSPRRSATELGDLLGCGLEEAELAALRHLMQLARTALEQVPKIEAFLLDCPTPTLRVAALRTIVRLAPERGEEAMVAAFERNDWAVIRAFPNALHAGDAVSPAAVERVTRALILHGSPAWRSEALMLLARCPASAARAIDNGLRGANSHGQAAALAVLRDAPFLPCVEGITQTFSRGSSALRDEVLGTVRAIGKAEYTALLVESLASYPSEAQSDLLQGLWRLPLDKTVAERLLVASVRSDPLLERMKTLLVPGSRFYVIAREVLESGLDSEGNDPEELLASMQIVHRLSWAATFKPKLAQLGLHPDLRVRRQATSLLDEIGAGR